MFPKRTAGAAVLAAVLLAAAVASAGAGDGKITICHHPEGQARTIDVAQSAWSAHESHGDHEGPCRSGAAQQAQQEPDQEARLDVTLRAAGEWDGDATFRIQLQSIGADARDAQLSGSLRGHGEWRVRSADADCAIHGRTFECDIGHVPADAIVAVRMQFDGRPSVCSEPYIDVIATASNGPDDQASARTRAGACALGEDLPVRSVGDQGP